MGRHYRDLMEQAEGGKSAATAASASVHASTSYGSTAGEVVTAAVAALGAVQGERGLFGRVKSRVSRQPLVEIYAGAQHTRQQRLHGAQDASEKQRRKRKRKKEKEKEAEEVQRRNPRTALLTLMSMVHRQIETISR